MIRARFIALLLVTSTAALPAQTRPSSAARKPTSASTAAQRSATSEKGTSVLLNDDNPRALRLSLDEAIRRTLTRNLGIRIERYDHSMSGYTARAAYGPFDWQLFANVQAQKQETPVVSSFESPESRRFVANYGVEQLLPTGGNYSLGFNNTRSASNSPFTNVNPAYNSNLAFSATQPLLRNFGIDVNRRGIDIARNNLGISREAFRTVLMQTVLLVEQTYLDLVYARRNIEVRLQSLALARDQERITQIRIDVGASAPLDILQPRVATATREEEIISAEGQLLNAEDRLRQLMNLDAEDWDRPIVPTDSVSFQPMTIDLDASVGRAMTLRPEITQANLTSEIRRIQHLFARNQTLPRFDLNADYGFAGLGGNRTLRDANNIPIGVDEGSYFNSVEQIFGFDNPGWTLGFNVGIPVKNIGARSEQKRAELDLERSRQQKESTKQNIMVEVRQTARSIQTLARQIAATRVAREAAERNLDAERKRFENGMTTNFNVLIVQQQLSDARIRELQALVAYNQSIAAHHRAVGDILEVRGIAVEGLENFSLPRGPYDDVKWLNYSHYSDYMREEGKR